MRPVLVAALAALLLSGCVSSTPYGRCIGAFDEGDPKFRYRTEALIVLGLVFWETLVIPAVVLIKETKCPVAPTLPPPAAPALP